MTMLIDTLAKIVADETIDRDQARAAMAHIMSGEATEAQIGGFLVALRMRGETAEQISGFAEAMRESSIRVHSAHPNLVDTCGTGGDALDSFNISTAAALVTAAAGAPVAKHGNRSVSSRCGSADVLTALGVRIDLAPSDAEVCLDEVGIGFLFAPSHHPAMKHAIGPRRELGLRTVFNILGPLTNPAGATRQILGVFAPELTELLARTLADLGSDHALVVHGLDGLDELSTLGETQVSELRDGSVETYTAPRRCMWAVWRAIWPRASRSRARPSAAARPWPSSTICAKSPGGWPPRRSSDHARHPRRDHGPQAPGDRGADGHRVPRGGAHASG
jgi:anthranilate phosphoribosyltransferase